MNDREVINAFVDHLSNRGHPGLVVQRWPEDQNRQTKEIDAIAGPFAIEHTSIDSTANLRRDDDRYLQIVGGLSDELSVHKEVTVIVPDRAMSGGTIFALSADRIVMDHLSCLGPIDPQIERDGKLVSATIGTIDEDCQGRTGTVIADIAALRPSLRRGNIGQPYVPLVTACAKVHRPPASSYSVRAASTR